MLSDDNLDFSLSEDYDITSNIGSNFGGETLFIAGSSTVSELPEYMNRQMAYYPRSSYQEIQGTGHTGPWEKSAEVSQLIQNFIQ